ncbi:MAG: tetraacyldisaccharide 4'-kinase [Betaproteobacteria bacterium]|nr:MAG: tetraacyldisaccharide 4'-kinase [Betaproteobacteria bacterium]
MNLSDHWYRKTALSRLLWPASAAFGAIVFLRRLLFRLRLLRSHAADVPVIAIGNLVAGGAGKTPLALWMAEFLRARGWSPAIVSRGYGGSVQAPCEATLVSDPGEVGDEPVVLARRSGCPVWVGPDRLQAIAALRRQHPECNVVILDDGLQHYRLRRDLEIAIVDARGFGNGWLLPAGPLREPPSRLRSVDAVIAHGTEAVKGYAMRLEGEELHRATDARERRALKSFAGERVHAVAGIGDPERFFGALRRHGIDVLPHPYPDHHPFRAGDLEFGDTAPVMMTEKDAVKCKRFARPHHWVLPVHAVVEAAFGEWLLHKLGERKTR